MHHISSSRTTLEKLAILVCLASLGTLAAGCPPVPCNGEECTPTVPDITPTEQASIDTGVTEEAWTTGRFYHQAEKLRGYLEVTLHIYEYNNGAWCGYQLYEIDTIQYRVCTLPNCTWYTPSDPADQTATEYALAFGWLLYDPQLDADANLYGWGPVEDEWGAPPADPTIIPGDMDIESTEFPPSWTGHFDMEPSPSYSTIYSWDPIEQTFERSGLEFVIDIGPHNMTSTTLTTQSGTDIEDWCDGWVNTL